MALEDGRSRIARLPDREPAQPSRSVLERRDAAACAQRSTRAYNSSRGPNRPNPVPDRFTFGAPRLTWSSRTVTRRSITIRPSPTRSNGSDIFAIPGSGSRMPARYPSLQLRRRIGSGASGHRGARPQQVNVLLEPLPARAATVCEHKKGKTDVRLSVSRAELTHSTGLCAAYRIPRAVADLSDKERSPACEPVCRGIRRHDLRQTFEDYIGAASDCLGPAKKWMDC